MRGRHCPPAVEAELAILGPRGPLGGTAGVSPAEQVDEDTVGGYMRDEQANPSARIGDVSVFDGVHEGGLPPEVACAPWHRHVQPCQGPRAPRCDWAACGARCVCLIHRAVTHLRLQPAQQRTSKGVGPVRPLNSANRGDATSAGCAPADPRSTYPASAGAGTTNAELHMVPRLAPM